MNNTSYHIRLTAIQSYLQETGDTLKFNREIKQLHEDISRAITRDREAKKNTVNLLDLFEIVSDLDSHE